MIVQEFFFIVLSFLCFISIALQIFIVINIIKIRKTLQKTEQKIDEKVEELKEWMKEPFELEEYDEDIS